MNLGRFSPGFLLLDQVEVERIYPHPSAGSLVEAIAG
jgi:hypothetical protein